MQQPLTTFLNDSYKNNYFPENETYDVTNYLTGVFPISMEIMSKALNFTYSVYKRKDGSWGSPKYKNGTLILPGKIVDFSHFCEKCEIQICDF